MKMIIFTLPDCIFYKILLVYFPLPIRYPFNLKMSNKSDNICFGDVVSLYYEDDGIHGYYYLNGLVDQRGGTIEIQKKNGFPPNFQRFLFKIQYANHYVAWKKFQKELEARGRKNFDFRKLIEDSNQTLTEEEKLSNKILTELQLKCEEEEKNNIKESGRSTGKVIFPF